VGAGSAWLSIKVVAARDQVVAALRQLKELAEPYKLFPKQFMARGVR
jgi:hypothetical protein